MRIGPEAALLLSLLLPLACSEPPAEPGELYRAPAISNEVDGVVFEAGNWEPHLPAGDKGVSWGNHRAVVEVSPGEEAGAVLVTIPWRRHDRDPASKAVIVVDAATGMVKVIATYVRGSGSWTAEGRLVVTVPDYIQRIR